MPRTEIQVEVLGLEDLRSLNTALSRHDKLLTQVAETYGKFKSATASATGTVQQAVDVQKAHTKSLKDTSDTAERATRSMGGMAKAYLEYRALSAVFQGVQAGAVGAMKAMVDLDYQAARSTRILGVGRRGEAINSII